MPGAHYQFIILTNCFNYIKGEKIEQRTFDYVNFKDGFVFIAWFRNWF